MRLKRFLFALPIVLALTFLTALLVARPYFGDKSNDFVSYLTSDPSKLNPILSGDATSGAVIDHMFNGLIKYDENLNIVGDLAKSWEIRQESHFFLKADSGLTAAQAVSLIEKKLPEAVRAECKFRTIKPAASDRVRLDFDSGGTAWHEAVLKIIPADKIDPVKLITVKLDTKLDYPDGSKCNADNTIGRLKKAFADVPGLSTRILEYTVEMSSKLVVHVRGDESVAVKVINKTLQSVKGRIADIETRLLQDEPIITFHLRRGVKFHNGMVFTSKDVRFLYDKMMDEKTMTVRRPSFEPIKELLTPDPYTVVVRYKKSYASAIASWGYGILPADLYGAEEDFNNSELNQKPIGTGPFKLVEWKAARHIRLEAFEDYFEGKPQIDAVVFRIVPEVSLAQMEFMSRGFDIYGSSPWSRERFKSDNRFNFYEYPRNSYTYIGWNMANELFSDVCVRRALTMAINREEIVKYVYWGAGRICNGIFPPHMWYSNPNVKPLPYDPEASKRLLAEAGWKDTDNDGILDKDGKPFRFMLVYGHGNEQRKNIAEIVQQQLKKLGIDIDIAGYEWTVFIDERINKRNFEACVLGWNTGLDPDPYSVWHSSQREKGFNFVNYVNPEVDRLIKLARAEFDREKRKKLLFKIHRLIYDDQPYTFLIVPDGGTVIYEGEFKIRRRDPKTGKFVDEDIKMTKNGITYYLNNWYRVGAKPELQE